MKKFLLVFLLLLAGCVTTPRNFETTDGQRPPRDECRSSRVICPSEISGSPTWERFIKALPGVSWDNGSPHIRNSRHSPIYVVDGMKILMFNFEVNAFDVKSVEVVTNPTEIHRYAGFGSAGGLIIIKTRV